MGDITATPPLEEKQRMMQSVLRFTSKRPKPAASTVQIIVGSSMYAAIRILKPRSYHMTLS
eukprot:4963104-Amphidinium_carterae.1